MTSKTYLTFGKYRIDRDRRLLLCDDAAISLPYKAFSLLHALVSRHGELVTKNQLIEHVWEDGPTSDANLSQHIFMLRSILKERSGDHHYIATVPGKGYRFVAPVREVNDVPKHSFVNQNAYRAWMKGRYYLDRRTEDSLNLALESFELATTLEPSSPRAHVGVAMSLCCLASYQYRAPTPTFDLARAAALRALELDAAMVEAESMLGAIHLFFDWDFPAAGLALSRALSKNPVDTDTLNARTWLSLAVGSLDEALAHAEAAILVDPSALHLQATLGLVYQCGNQPARAIKHFQALLEMDDTFHLARYYLGSALLQVGDFRDGVRELEHVASVDRTVRSMASLAYGYAVTGRDSEALPLLEELQGLRSRRYVSLYDLAMPLVGLRRFDDALSLLRSARDERATGIIFMATEPRFAALRGDSQFRELIVK